VKASNSSSGAFGFRAESILSSASVSGAGANAVSMSIFYGIREIHNSYV